MNDGLIFSRTFAMPNAETFTIGPIGRLVRKYASAARRSVDPFARNSDVATVTNDLDCATNAAFHMEAGTFLAAMKAQGESFDLGIFDPPYSPRQISECYRSIGLPVTKEDTQNGATYRRVRDALDAVIAPDGVVLSFGWNSNGMGIGRGYVPIEILMVQHGGAHNDTICVVERKVPSP